MKKSIFEKALQEKANSYKPLVSPKVFERIEAEIDEKKSKKVGIIRLALTSGKLGLIKSIAANATYTLTTKAAVITISVITSISAITTSIIVSNDNDHKLVANAYGISKTSKSIINLEKLHNVKKPIDYKINYALAESNFITENNFAIKEDTVSKFETVNSAKKIIIHNKTLTAKPIFPKLRFSNYKDTLKVDHELDFIINPPYKPQKLTLIAELKSGTSTYLKPNESSNSLNENNSGRSIGASITIQKKILRNLYLASKIEYISFDNSSQYFSNNQKDGEIQRNIKFGVLKFGARYDVYKNKNYTINIASNAGVAYKLYHNNVFSGKFFDDDLKFNLKDVDRFCAAIDFALNADYKFYKKIKIGASIYTNFLAMNKNYKLFENGLKLRISYAI